MFIVSRRSTIKTLISCGLLFTLSRVKAQDGSFEDFKRQFVENANKHWKEISDKELAEAKIAESRGEFSSFEPPRHLTPFKDWDFYFTEGGPSRWWPNSGQAGKPVTVPAGFVTDLASIPQILWSTGLRPEGAYAHAAVVHDYLYWVQDRSREESDKVFLYAMEDSKVDQTVRDRIYRAVRTFGNKAWNNNAKLKAQGERRILSKTPTDRTITWQEWKNTPDVFAD